MLYRSPHNLLAGLEQPPDEEDGEKKMELFSVHAVVICAQAAWTSPEAAVSDSSLSKSNCAISAAQSPSEVTSTVRYVITQGLPEHDAEVQLLFGAGNSVFSVEISMVSWARRRAADWAAVVFAARTLNLRFVAGARCAFSL